MPRVTFVIHSLGMGGAERIMSIIANYWAERGWDITLLTLDGREVPPFFALDPLVTHRSLGIARQSAHLLQGVTNNIGRIARLRAALRTSAPEVIISFMDQTNVLTIFAALGLGVPVIVVEHNDPYQRRLGRGWSLIRHCAYLRADRLIVLHESALAYFLPRIRTRARVLYNPVVLPADSDEDQEPHPADSTKVIVAMGRLVEQKGFDLLLRAFAKVAAKHPDWRLDIWGEGPARPALEALRSQLGLDGRARLPGKTRSPRKKMRQADLFVLSSRYEGFPTVLCEAMACGTPVLSFDCPTGPAEIIRHEVNGMLVPAGDIDAFAAAMDRLMGNEAHRKAFGARAPEVLARFGLEPTMGLWEDMLTQLLQPHRSILPRS